MPWPRRPYVVDEGTWAPRPTARSLLESKGMKVTTPDLEHSARMCRGSISKATTPRSGPAGLLDRINAL